LKGKSFYIGFTFIVLRSTLKGIILKANLTGEDAKRFLQVKRILGLASNAETLRYLINAYHRKTLKKKEVPAV